MLSELTIQVALKLIGIAVLQQNGRTANGLSFLPQTSRVSSNANSCEHRLVPKAQPEISQTRSVWYRGKRKSVLKGRWKLIFGVAPRHGQTILGVYSQLDRLCHPRI
jgi:hypothetical protein